MKSTISPLTFIETHKQVIALNLKENLYITLAIDDVISCLNGIITNLLPIRSDAKATDDYLSYLLGDNPKETLSSIPNSYKCFIENWLFKALDDDATFVYAFNHICNKYNKDNPLPINTKDPEECLSSLVQNRKQVKSAQEKKVQRNLRIAITEEIIIAFQKLFRDKRIAERFITRLIENGYIKKDESWIGISGNLTELLAIYQVISDPSKNILIPGKPLSQVKIFYPRFGLPYGKGKYISEPSLRINPSKEDANEAKRIFSDFI